MKTQKNRLPKILQSFTFILSTILMALLVSCDGQDGLDGRDGIDGKDGGLVYADVYELKGDFTANNNYQFGLTFSGNGLYEGDVVLVYILWKTENGTDIWRMLPQTEILSDNGTITYNYDFTTSDVMVFLEYQLNGGTLDQTYTDNQTFKVVVVPGNNYATLKSIDKSDINNLINNPDIKINTIN